MTPEQAYAHARSLRDARMHARTHAYTYACAPNSAGSGALVAEGAEGGQEGTTSDGPGLSTLDELLDLPRVNTAEHAAVC